MGLEVCKCFDRGVFVQFDNQKVQPGVQWPESIESTLRESDVIVSVMSPGNTKDSRIFFELGAALGLHKRLISIVPEDVHLSSVPRFLTSRPYLIKRSPEEAAKEVAKAVREPAVA